jgi:hypothetical protein
VEFSEAIALSHDIASFGRSIEDMWSLATSTFNISLQHSAQYNMKRTINLINEKLDAATARLLRFADQGLNKYQELQVEEYTKNLSIGIWGSYADLRPSRKAMIFDKIGINLDAQKQILTNENRFVFRVIRMSLESITLDDYLPNSSKLDNNGLQKCIILGDLITIDLLKSPPDSYSIRAKRWTIRDKSSHSLTLQKSPYPSTVTMRCAFKVPEEVFMTDDVTLSRWIEEESRWSDEGITDFTYSESTRQAQFYSIVVGTFALIKRRNVDMPYRKWSLQPLRNPPGENTETPTGSIFEQMARFTIATQKHEVAIDLVGTKVKLVRPICKQLNDLIGVEMLPGTLLRQLQRRGINIWPVPKVAKDDLAKDREYKVMIVNYYLVCFI